MDKILWAILVVQVATLCLALTDFMASRYDRQVDEARRTHPSGYR